LSTFPQEDPLTSPFRDGAEERQLPPPTKTGAGNDAAAAAESPCRSCGACCSYSREWPRFSLEDDATLALIPRAYVDDGEAAMRCNGDRCAALVGEVGVGTSCAVYDVRPDVCRACDPGDDACAMARHRFGMESLPRS
jgi:Fe-S-cluster containining protein